METDKVKVLCLVPKSQREMKVRPETWAELTRKFEVTANESERNWTSDELAEGICDYDAVLTGWGSPPFTEKVWEKAEKLKLIVHMAGSVKFLFPNDVVQRFCIPRNITVVSCAHALAINVAEMTIALMVMAARRLYEHIQAVRERGAWKDKSLPTNFPTINGSTVGIIGASRVGREVIRLLRAYRDVRILLYDPYVTAEQANELGATLTDLETLFAESDFISLHAPLTKQTVGMIGERHFALMKDGAIFINTARGKVVDTDALVKALQTRQIFAALDVTDPEPIPADHPLRFLPNCYITPHIAGAGFYGYFQIGEMTLKALSDFFEKGVLPEGTIDWSVYETIA
ncbi:MAG: hydroxyacid dehydrogenase [Armatimonadota bacterium]|nr:hydroxyacid dehydrogenase [Armatimonadota bacterium]MDW8142214.1 hydroxyacid dehydrogenase [Armatimonadota bacterium]